MIKARRKNRPIDYQKAAKLRQQFSYYEQILWKSLKQMPGLKFRRQHPIHPYITDFACLNRRLIIELDGESHSHAQDYDQKRDHYMMKLGYDVLRFSNNEVINNLEGVIAAIIQRAHGKQIRKTSHKSIHQRK